VGAAFDNLLAQHAPLKSHLFEDSGEFRSFVNVYLNDDDIRQLSGRDTPVADGDLIQIVPSIAGGWT
jgi:adenylyltransferase/sulfurtransferase